MSHRASLSASRYKPVPLPGFRVLDNLSTDDPHWRRTTIASVVLSAAAAAGARRRHGVPRALLSLAAVLCSLPALSLAAMVTVALLLRRLERQNG
jgi:hypothetical protein